MIKHDLNEEVISPFVSFCLERHDWGEISRFIDGTSLTDDEIIEVIEQADRAGDVATAGFARIYLGLTPSQREALPGAIDIVCRSLSAALNDLKPLH